MRDERAPRDPLLDAGALARFLRQHHLPPLDRFGQHFLVDADVLADIVAASETDPRIPVIEIGAGLGVLTRALAAARQEAEGRRHPTSPRLRGVEQERAPIIAVELDRRLMPLLRERVREFPQVHVVQKNILRLDVQAQRSTLNSPRTTQYDVIGNIPYNITAPLLEKFLAHPPKPRRLTLLVDDAVAAAIAAAPPDMSVRAVSAQVYAEPVLVRRRIPPSAFVPPPAVHSAILVLRVRATPLVPPTDERAFFRLVRAGFAQRRKMLSNALAATYRLPPAEAAERLRHAGIDPRRRAETLSLTEWQNLLAAWH